jgi:hypothetical protein
MIKINSIFMSCVVASTELWGHNSLVRVPPKTLD